MNAKATMQSMVLCLCLLSISAVVQADVHWKQFMGSHIRFLMNKHPFTTFIEPRIPEFEKLTGIKVTIEVFSEKQFWNRCLIELNSGAQVDGMMIMPGQTKLYYWQAGWLQPLDAFIANPELTAADWDIADFFAAPMRDAAIENQQIGIVLNPEVSLLAYRKDIFDRFHRQPPETMEQLEAAARFFHGKEVDGQAMSGITLRGGGAIATSQWVDFLYSFGGSWLNEEGQANIAAPESIAAFTFYGDLLRKYGPPEPADLHWIDSTLLFMQGRAAMIFDANVFKALYEKPNESRVAGKVGYTTIPAGPAGKVPHISTWSLAVSATSTLRQQQAAWLFIQWMTDKQNSLDALLSGVPVGRKSAWDSPEYQSQDRYPDWTAATVNSFEIGQPQWNPPVLNISTIRDIVGQVILDAIAGNNVEASAQANAKRMNQSMER